MKFPIALCCIATFVLFSDPQRTVHAKTIAKRDTYTTKYDKIDIDRILNSQRLMQNYVNCLLDKGACTAEGAELKKYLPDALQTECSKCSPAQKKLAGKVLSNLLQFHRKEFFEPLLDKYDKEGIFRKKYEEKDVEYQEYDE